MKETIYLLIADGLIGLLSLKIGDITMKRSKKLARKLLVRIKDWEQTTQNTKGKDSKAYRKPGSNK